MNRPGPPIAACRCQPPVPRKLAALQPCSWSAARSTDPPGDYVLAVGVALLRRIRVPDDVALNVRPDRWRSTLPGLSVLTSEFDMQPLVTRINLPSPLIKIGHDSLRGTRIAGSENLQICDGGG
jgi:hypothetical protein